MHAGIPNSARHGKKVAAADHTVAVMAVNAVTKINRFKTQGHRERKQGNNTISTILAPVRGMVFL
jgi:hypothetical protein